MVSYDVAPHFCAALDAVRLAAGQAGHTVAEWHAPADPPVSTVLPPAYYHDARCTGCGRVLAVMGWHGHPVRVTGFETETSGLATVADWRPGPCLAAYCGDRAPQDRQADACACRFGAVDARCSNVCHCHDRARAAVRDSLARTSSPSWPGGTGAVRPILAGQTVAEWITAGARALTPHPVPAGQADDVLTCAGCGHPVAALDDTAAQDDVRAPDGFVVWHVDCPGPVAS